MLIRLLSFRINFIFFLSHRQIGFSSIHYDIQKRALAMPSKSWLHVADIQQQRKKIILTFHLNESDLACDSKNVHK